MSSPPHQQTLTGRNSHATIPFGKLRINQAGLVLGGSLTKRKFICISQDKFCRDFSINIYNQQFYNLTTNHYLPYKSELLTIVNNPC